MKCLTDARDAGDRMLQTHWLEVAQNLEDLVGSLTSRGSRAETDHGPRREAMHGLADIAENVIHVCNGEDHGMSIHNIEARTGLIADVIGTDAEYAEIVRLLLQRCRSISATPREERRTASVYTPEIMAAARDLLRLKRHVARVLS